MAHTDRVTELLEYLERAGVGEPTDVSKLLLNYYPISDKTMSSQSAASDLYQKMRTFLNHLIAEGFIVVDITDLNSLTETVGYDVNRRFKWLDDVKLDITLKPRGLEYLKAERQRIKDGKQQELLNKANETIIDANTATIANAITQANYARKQTYIFLLTLFVTCVYAFITYLSYRRDVSKDRLEQKIQKQDKQIEQLRHQLQLKGSVPERAITASDSLGKQ